MSLLIAGFRFSKIVGTKRSSFWSNGSLAVSRMGLSEREDVVEGRLGFVSRKAGAKVTAMACRGITSGGTPCS